MLYYLFIWPSHSPIIKAGNGWVKTSFRPCLMRMYSSRSTCVEVDWSEIKLSSIPFHSNTWIEVNTRASKQGLTGLVFYLVMCDLVGNSNRLVWFGSVTTMGWVGLELVLDGSAKGFRSSVLASAFFTSDRAHGVCA